MKGIVFNEFLELVEMKFGLDAVEDVIESSQLKSGGSYTGVGTYDHKEIIAMVISLSKRTGIPAKDLVIVFGEYLLLNVFAKKFPLFFENKNVFSFLKSIDNIIHVEVKKLYPDADLPTITFTEIDKNNARLVYFSKKPFADLALGLVQGSMSFFKEDFEITYVDLSNPPGTSREFILKRRE